MSRVGWRPAWHGAPTSWFTVTLVGMMAAVMVVEMTMPYQRLRWMVDTFGLHASESNWADPHFLATLVSSQFIHGSSEHFFWNTLLLLFAGATLEQRIGWRNTLWIWLLGAIFSSLAHVAFLPGTEKALIGASGGLSAMLGAAFVVGAGIGLPVRLRRGGRTLFTITMPVAVGIWASLQVVAFVQFLIESPAPEVAYWSHLAGLAFGALAATTLFTTSGWRLAGRSSAVTETVPAGD